MSTAVEMDVDMDERYEIWNLSKQKTAQWTPRNDLLIIKKNPGGGIYKVFVHTEACKGMKDNKEELFKIMEKVKKGESSNPTNFVVYSPEDTLPSVVQLSVFGKHPKFGIHILDSQGRVCLSKGLNLTTYEFHELLNMFESLPPIPINPQNLIVCIRQYLWRWKHALQFQNDKEESRNISVYTPVSYTPVSNEKWYVNSETCFIDAEQARPKGPYHLDIVWKSFHYRINEELVDAAVMRLVIHHMNKMKEQDLMRKAISEEESQKFDSLLALYGLAAFQRVKLSEIYHLLRKLINMSENLSPLLYATAMSLISKRGKRTKVLEELVRNGLTGNTAAICLQIPMEGLDKVIE